MAFIHSGMLEKHLQTFCLALNECIFFLGQCLPPMTLNLMPPQSGERLKAGSMRYKTKGQASPLSTNMRLKLFMMTWKT